MRRVMVLNRGALPQTLPVTSARDLSPARHPLGCACVGSGNRTKDQPQVGSERSDTVRLVCYDLLSGDRPNPPRHTRGPVTRCP